MRDYLRDWRAVRIDGPDELWNIIAPCPLTEEQYALGYVPSQFVGQAYTWTKDLVVAAPDLLSVVMEIVSTFRPNEPVTIPIGLWVRANDAITKAMGEERIAAVLRGEVPQTDGRD